MSQYLSIYHHVSVCIGVALSGYMVMQTSEDATTVLVGILVTIPTLLTFCGYVLFIFRPNLVSDLLSSRTAHRRKKEPTIEVIQSGYSGLVKQSDSWSRREHRRRGKIGAKGRKPSRETRKQDAVLHWNQTSSSSAKPEDNHSFSSGLPSQPKSVEQDAAMDTLFTQQNKNRRGRRKVKGVHKSSTSAQRTHDISMGSREKAVQDKKALTSQVQAPIQKEMKTDKETHEFTPPANPVELYSANFKAPTTGQKGSAHKASGRGQLQQGQELVQNQTSEIPWQCENDFYNFVLGTNGGILCLSCLVLHFQPGCVKREKKLKLKCLSPEEPRENRRFAHIAPEIQLCDEKFCSTNFECPVQLKLRPTITPEGCTKEVFLEVLESLQDTRWKRIETQKFINGQEFISVQLQRFARFRVVCECPKPDTPACDLYHAVFVKRPTGISDPIEHIFYILIHSDDKKVCNEANAMLDSPSAEVVGHKEMLSVRPPCTVTTSLICEDMTSSPRSIDYDIDIVGSRILETFPIIITKEDPDQEFHPLQSVRLKYGAWTINPNRYKLLPFRWSVPVPEPQCPSCSNSSVCSFQGVNGGIGQQNNITYNNCTIQAPYGQGASNLPHNKSEPSLGMHPHAVLREKSLPADLGKMAQSIPEDMWHYQNQQSTAPFPIPVSDESLQHNSCNLDQNETVPKSVQPNSERRFASVTLETHRYQEQTEPNNVILDQSQRVPKLARSRLAPSNKVATIVESLNEETGPRPYEDQDGKTEPKATFRTGEDRTFAAVVRSVNRSSDQSRSTVPSSPEVQCFSSNTSPKSVFGDNGITPTSIDVHAVSPVGNRGESEIGEETSPKYLVENDAMSPSRIAGAESPQKLPQNTSITSWGEETKAFFTIGGRDVPGSETIPKHHYDNGKEHNFVNLENQNENVEHARTENVTGSLRLHIQDENSVFKPVADPVGLAEDSSVRCRSAQFTAPNHNPFAFQFDSRTSGNPTTSGFKFASGEETLKCEIFNQTVPKEIASETEFEDIPPNSHSTPVKPLTLPKLPNHVSAESNPTTDAPKTNLGSPQTTPDSGIEDPSFRIETTVPGT